MSDPVARLTVVEAPDGSEHLLRSLADSARRLKSAPYISQVRWEFYDSFGLVPRRPCVDSRGVTLGGLRFEYRTGRLGSNWFLSRVCVCGQVTLRRVRDQVELSRALGHEPQCWRCWVRSKLRVTLRREVRA